MNKILTQGIAKAVRKKILTDATIGYINDNLLLRAFLDELNERSTIKTQMSRLRCDEFLWYITYEGRLGMVKKGGMKSNAEKLLRDKWIVRDCYGVYRGTRVIDGRGCQCPKHRPIIYGMSKERWAPQIVNRLCDLLDGGHELKMVIDRNFYDAYEPDYEHNTNIEDLVCSYSCMSNRPSEADEFYGGIEGCYVARFLNEDGDNVGRCIMYTDGKIRHFVRIYCYEEYQRDCLYTLKHNMKPDDLFGRDEYIHGLRLPTNFTPETPNMYLDGVYGLKVEDGKLWVVDRGYDRDCGSTGDGYISDEWEGIAECHACGRMISTSREDEFIYDNSDGYYYCCEECAEEYDCVRCEHCGEWCCGIETTDGRRFCCGTCARAEGYRRTDHDGDWALEDDLLVIEGCYYYKDEDEAMRGGWDKCADCGRWVRSQYRCTDGKHRCNTCLADKGWELKFVKKEVQDEKTETSND